MNLIIDIGNSRVKLAWFEKRSLLDSETLNLPLQSTDFKSITKNKTVDFAAISNVNNGHQDWLNLSVNKSVLFIDNQTPLPIDLLYKTPETLGIDRICAAVAAHHKFPDVPVLSIDMGTCITYDFIDEKGSYHGGGISPGYKMRLDAMHSFTDRLPIVHVSKEFSSIGASTEESMLFGAGRGIVEELNGLIAFFKANNPNLKVILTGGDHSMFEQHIENRIFAAPNLVLEGINEILLYNIALNE